ncbi:hypothetical protein ACHHYP_15407 [Achlya hypogyna]|uniref:LicD/FKTN/FKRP nucleotidyltransferase domain-containing protein n=1 Tax=Achlya hypogyna TaxID=1202772 RepID=A0A1V9ZF00_ACHHY|nr:hypothetical protein ACHHYP_15407 [Achlya hypogyna]
MVAKVPSEVPTRFTTKIALAVTASLVAIFCLQATVGSPELLARHFRAATDGPAFYKDEKGGIHIKDPEGKKDCVVLWTGHLNTDFMNTSHCYDLAEQQTYIREMVYTFADLMDAHGIEYWVDSGTLLGVFRNKSLISFDTDADVGLTQASLDKLRHTNVSVPAHYELFVNDSPFYRDGPYSYLPARFVHTLTGIYIDMFEFLPTTKVEVVSKTEVVDLNLLPSSFSQLEKNGTKVQIETTKNTSVHMELTTHEKTEVAMLGPVPSICWWECHKCEGRHFNLPRDWIFPLERCQFDDRMVWCPAKAKEYLTILYGDDFMTPVFSH